MSKVTISVDVEKEVNDVGVFISNLLIAIKQKKSASEILAAELQDLIKAIDGLEKIPAEYAEDKAAFAKAIMLPLVDGIMALTQ